MVSPPPEMILPYQTIHLAHHHLTRLNKISDFHMLPMTTTDEGWQIRVRESDRAWDANLKLRDAVVSAVKRLDDRYAISVEVVDAG